jgi:hypothetical protein
MDPANSVQDWAPPTLQARDLVDGSRETTPSPDPYPPYAYPLPTEKYIPRAYLRQTARQDSQQSQSPSHNSPSDSI